MSPDDVQALKDTYSTSNSEELKNLKAENTSLKQQVAGFNRKELLNKVAADNKLPSSAAQFLKERLKKNSMNLQRPLLNYSQSLAMSLIQKHPNQHHLPQIIS